MVLAVSLPSHGAAQGADPESEETDAAIDEITIEGARTLDSMRAQVILAEDEAFALFNELNEDDGYDIICKKETRIGSQMPHRVCLSRMYRERLAEATADAIDENSGVIGVGRMPGQSKHQEILREKMRTLAMKHPELLAALKKRYVLDKAFQEARDRKYGE